MIYVALFALLLLGCSGDDQSSKEDAADDSIAKLIEDFNNRTIYESLDEHTLASIADDDVEMAVVDYVETKLRDVDDKISVLRSLSPGCRHLWVTWLVEGEVNNGGFNQLYWNTEDRYNDLMIAAFEYFSATEHMKIISKANAVRLDEIMEMAKYKAKNTIKAFSDSYDETKLSPIDDLYYNAKADLSSLRVAKIRQVPTAFCGD